MQLISQGLTAEQREQREVGLCLSSLSVFEENNFSGKKFHCYIGVV